ncbi:GNAT family acetyltransferase [uncultured Pseudodesulfovibrio sp.]|uniref:GNAT family acetyltransferase n=1 Tax=uncultured Pseudodesulfovibrio sp. TaxID=2035858 RepID=UPI0029C7486E|nr:GNAT family acetyltransferase [uncultured Pseudodesulfovibrio sp.]
MSITINTYNDSLHRERVMALWREVFGYPAAYNDPAFVIDRKIAVDDLFWVAEDGGEVAGTIMAGYDGHRGWIYSLTVTQGLRGQGLGSRLLDHALCALKKIGCVKVNLQILESNETVRRFYEANGFTVEPRLSMGKVLK